MSDEPQQPPWVGTANGRGQFGHFAKGNALSRGQGGGNPNAKLQAAHKRALMEAGSSEKIQKVAESLFALACGGDVQAAKVLLDHWVGRPSQALEITGLDADPVKIDVANLTTVILGALGSHPEARYAVAAALRQISQSKLEGNGNGPGNGHSNPA